MKESPELEALTIALGVDSGCIYCVEKALHALTAARPDVDWAALIRAQPEDYFEHYSREEYASVAERLKG